MFDHDRLMKGISRESGAFAMVAMDGRGSLKGILREAGLTWEVDDLGKWKTVIARAVGGRASAMLIDLGFGREASTIIRDEYPTTGLISSVDKFVEGEFGGVESTVLDVEAMDAIAEFGGARALKHYVFWRDAETQEWREQQTRAFIEGSHERGALALLEGIVQGDPESKEFDDALVEAAREFGSYGPDVYKAQVPNLGRKSSAEIQAVAERITEAVRGPWVALSNGVDTKEFPRAVEAVCKGGASGFLAGRGVWKDAVMASHDPEVIIPQSQARLDELIAIVDEYARPWFEAVEVRS